MYGLGNPSACTQWWFHPFILLFGGGVQVVRLLEGHQQPAQHLVTLPDSVSLLVSASPVELWVWNHRKAVPLARVGHADDVRWCLCVVSCHTKPYHSSSVLFMWVLYIVVGVVLVLSLYLFHREALKIDQVSASLPHTHKSMHFFFSLLSLTGFYHCSYVFPINR